MRDGLMECWRAKKLHSLEEEARVERVEDEVFVLEEDMEYSFYPSGDSLFSLSELFWSVCLVDERCLCKSVSDGSVHLQSIIPFSVFLVISTTSDRTPYW